MKHPRASYWLVLLAVAALGVDCSDDGSSTATGGGAGAGGVTTGTAGECQVGETEPCYSGTDETRGQGICRDGVRFCGPGGVWSDTCHNEVLAATEICANGIDEDCDGADAPAATCLAGNEHLVVRHFLDESDGSMTLADASENQIQLTLAGTGAATALDELDGHRGLRWAINGSTIRAYAPVDATFVGAFTANAVTIEAVVAIDEPYIPPSMTEDVFNGSPIVYIGGDLNTPHMALFVRYEVANPYDPQLVTFQFNGTEVGSWRTVLSQRCVLHLVVDTAAMPPRLELYRNGARVQPIAATAPTGMLAPSAGMTYVLGNRSSEARSFKGRLYYSAVYNDALDVVPLEMSTQLQVNSDLLRKSDDKADNPQ